MYDTPRRIHQSTCIDATTVSRRQPYVTMAALPQSSNTTAAVSYISLLRGDRDRLSHELLYSQTRMILLLSACSNHE
jgi:hypothetical protein